MLQTYTHVNKRSSNTPVLIFIVYVNLSTPGVRFSKNKRKLLGPENFSGLFSGEFLGSRKAFFKTPEFFGLFSWVCCTSLVVIGLKNLH